MAHIFGPYISWLKRAWAKTPPVGQRKCHFPNVASLIGIDAFALHFLDDALKGCARDLEVFR